MPAVALLYTFKCLPSHVPCVVTEDPEDELATPPAMPEFIPSFTGLTHELPDTVMVQVRLHRVNGRYQASYVTHIDVLHVIICVPCIPPYWPCDRWCNCTVMTTYYIVQLCVCIASNCPCVPIMHMRLLLPYMWCAPRPSGACQTAD